jgi:hypothetical protein
MIDKKKLGERLETNLDSHGIFDAGCIKKSLRELGYDGPFPPETTVSSRFALKSCKPSPKRRGNNMKSRRQELGDFVSSGRLWSLLEMNAFVKKHEAASSGQGRRGK